MKAIEWLLIGGPANGKKLSVTGGGAVRWRDDNGAEYLYHGQNYLHNCRLYRVGFIDPNDLLPSKVEKLIDETGLQHIAGS